MMTVPFILEVWDVKMFATYKGFGGILTETRSNMA